MKGVRRILALSAALCAAAGMSSLRGQDAASVNTDIPNMKALMMSEYRYAGDKSAGPARPAATLASGAVPAKVGAPAGVVQLPTVYVRAPKAHDAELTQAFADQERSAGQDAMMRKLGVGVLGVTAGKHFGAGVVTVFYVPVFVFAGFSW